MLILTRRVGESLYIDTPGGRIVISSLGVSGNQTRIGINAPKEYVILREELEYRSRGSQNNEKLNRAGDG